MYFTKELLSTFQPIHVKDFKTGIVVPYGVVVSTPCYEFVSPDSIFTLDSQHKSHPSVHPPFLAGQYKGTWGKLEKVNCGNPDFKTVLRPKETSSYQPQAHRIKRWRWALHQRTAKLHAYDFIIPYS